MVPDWVKKFRLAHGQWRNTDETSTQFPCALGTSSSDGKPHVWTVGHADLVYQAQFQYWNARSPKAEQIKASQDVEVCYWFQDTKEQFRVTGKAFIVDQASSDAVWLNERRRYFDTLKEIRKKHYGSREGPGTPIGETVGSPLDGDDVIAEMQALAHYALIVLRVESVDWVSQARMERLRWVYNTENTGEDEEQWTKEELVI